MKIIKRHIRYFKKKYHPILRTVPYDLRSEAWLRIASSNKYRFVYVRIPKAANSTIARTLAKHAYPNEQRLALDYTGRIAKKLFGNLGDLRYYSQQNVLKKFFVFSFFRNPFTRVLSAYLDKLQSEKNNKEYQWIANEMGFPDTKSMNFSDFITYLENGNLYKNAHWAPQVNLCPFSFDKLHFIGKVENIEEDLSLVINKIFGEKSYNGFIMINHNKQSANSRINDYYSEKLIKRVYKLYNKDISHLKYKFPC